MEGIVQYNASNNSFVPRLWNPVFPAVALCAILTTGSPAKIRNNFYTNEHNYSRAANDNEGTFMQNLYTINTIIYEETEYMLEKAITFNIHKDGDYHTIQYSDLDIEIYERSISSALSALYEEFDMLYQNYGLCDDAELTEGAKIIKKKMLSYVKEVKSIGHA